MSFRVESTPSQESIVVRIGNALDFRNAALFKKTCLEKAGEGVRHFILDFNETYILDSTGLGSIFSLQRKISASKGKVVFASVSRPVQTVVQLTRTDKVFRLFTTVQEAYQAKR